MIYLNCAATSYRRPDCVIDAVADAMRSLGSSGRGAAEGELDAARSVSVARSRVAELLGFSHPERVVFAANATDALNKAILGTVGAAASTSATAPRRVIATDWDHNSTLRPLYRLRDEQGVRVGFLRADRSGALDLAALPQLMEDGADLLCLTHASNLTGNVLSDEKIRAAADLAHANGALVLLDAAQTAGARPLSMEALGVDLLVFTGHKALMGPQGTGGLLVSPAAQVNAVVRGGTGVLSYEEGQPVAYPEHLEAGTLNGHGIAGLSAAVAWLQETGVARVRAHDLALTRRFAQSARALGATLYGDWPRDLDDPSFDHAPVVALNLPGWDSSSLADALDVDYGIATRAGGHCAPRMHRALGTEGEGAVRFSFGWFTTEADVDAALLALAELAEEETDAS